MPLVKSEQWTAEVEIGPGVARAAIARQFPELGSLAVEPFGEGWDNAAFLIGGTYVFRFPRRKVAVDLIERELGLLPVLASQLTLPIPVPLFAGDPSEVFPWPFAGYRLLEGKALDDALLGDDDLVALASQCGTFLRALHAVSPHSMPPLPGDTIGRLDHARCSIKIRPRLTELQRAGLIEDSAPWLEVLDGIAPDGPRADRACVVHGDLYVRHILVDERGVAAGIIDWGDVHVGDPSLDLAIAFSIFPTAVRSEFARAYGAMDERTWELARYRAIYHSSLVAHYGHTIGDRHLVRAGLDGLAGSL